MKFYSESFRSGYEQALSFVEHITDSSRLGVAPNNVVRSFLRATVTDGSYQVYRGLCLPAYDHSLVIGKDAPEQYHRPLAGPVCIHASLSRSVAESYARAPGFVMGILTGSHNVLFDSRQAERVFPDLSDDMRAYFRESQEVLLNLDAQFIATPVLTIVS